MQADSNRYMLAEGQLSLPTKLAYQETKERINRRVPNTTQYLCRGQKKIVLVKNTAIAKYLRKYWKGNYHYQLKLPDSSSERPGERMQADSNDRRTSFRSPVQARVSTTLDTSFPNYVPKLHRYWNETEYRDSR